MKPPPRAFDHLRAALPGLVQVGDVWWLPQHVVRFPGGNDRYCLIVGIQQTGGDAHTARAHYVVGSTRPDRGVTTVKVAAGTYGPGRDTYFKFFWSSWVDLATLTREGGWKGRLTPDRIAEIDKAIRASRLKVLKRMLGDWARRSRPAPRQAPPRPHRT